MRKLTTREQLTIDYLPECQWVIKAAGIKAGFSEKYAAYRLPGRMFNDVVLKSAYETKLAEIKAKSIANRQQRQQFWSNVMDGNAGFKASMGDKLRASELLGKSEADFTENINSTDTQRQRELDEREEAEAVRIAQIRLKDFKGAG